MYVFSFVQLMYLYLSITHTRNRKKIYQYFPSMLDGGITGDFFSKFATFNFFVFPKLYTMKEK